MEETYWIRPLLECLAIAFTAVFGSAYVVARLTQHSLGELFDLLHEILTR